MRWKEIIFIIIATIWVLYQLWTAYFGVFPTLQQGSLHLLFTLVLIYLLKLKSNVGGKLSNYVLSAFYLILIVISIYLCGYVAFNYFELELNVGSWDSWQLFISGIAIIIILDATRRVMGWPLVIFAFLFILYAYFGAYLPEQIAHRGFSVERIVGYLYLTAEGIFGVAIGVSATFLFMFILFGAVLREFGGGQFMTDIAVGGFGHVRGGPAKIAVVSSCLFGTVSGSGVANVATTGTFTIPLMKSIGYKPHFAAAVEAVASVGGQIMPPVMGASAFIMSEILQMPYYKVCLSAAVPAIIYYIALFVAVDLEAAKTGMKGIPKQDLPKIGIIIKKGWWFFLPPVVLLYLLIIPEYSPSLSAFWAIITNIIICLIVKRFSKDEFKNLFLSFKNAATGALEIAICCATVGIILGITVLTGLGLRLSGMLTTLAHGSLPILLILAMICSIILGMALPTVAVYLVLVIMIGPALIKMGVDPLAAHLFVFYFGITSQITPPVALAAYVGAGIAGAPPMKTGFTATKLGMVTYILPFMFVYGPALLLKGSALSITLAITSSILGVVSLAIGLQGYFLSNLRLWERTVIIVGSILMIKPGLTTDIIGLFFVILGLFRSLLERKRKITTISNSG